MDIFIELAQGTWMKRRKEHRKKKEKRYSCEVMVPKDYS
jgi:hypothetical protein